MKFYRSYLFVKFYYFLLFFLFNSFPVNAGNCELGSSGFKLIQNAYYSLQSVDTEQTVKSFHRSIDHMDWLSISFAIDIAEDWQKMEKFNRNFFGNIPIEKLNFINSKANNLLLNPDVWHVSSSDEDLIIYAKINVIKAAEFAKNRGLDLQGVASTSHIKTVTPSNSEAAAFDILSHTFVAYFRKIRLNSYWMKITTKLSDKFPGSYNSVSILHIKDAFNKDHPTSEDALDTEALKKLMIMRQPNGQTLYRAAMNGKLDSSALFQLTGRANLIDYFKFGC